MDEFDNRRKKLAAHMQNNSIALFQGAKELYRNGDATYPFRQNSDFFYFTGFSEPDAVMALIKDAKGKLSFILFNRPHDPEREIWDGKRAGQEGAREIYQADESFDINTINENMPKLFGDKQVIYYPIGLSKEFDDHIVRWLKTARKMFHSNNYKGEQKITSVPETQTDILPFVHELRLFKSEQEIEYLRKAAEISALAHLELMRKCEPGLMEYQLEAKFNEYCLNAGCRAFAYQAIVAGGNNSCTLHYISNDQRLNSGELVLIDAGGEYNCYAADITRTFPVNGKFTKEQREIYSLVLEAQLAGIEQVKPGNTIDSVQNVIVEIIVAGLIKLGIMSGDKKQLIRAEEYKRFYMHSSGHWLGLDVHDAGKYKINNQWRKFEPGMVLTVEPGIYIANNLTGVDPKWLGIGVRIEDDVLVTKHGYEVLSAKAPKTIAEIESAAL